MSFSYSRQYEEREIFYVVRGFQEKAWLDIESAWKGLEAFTIYLELHADDFSHPELYQSLLQIHTAFSLHKEKDLPLWLEFDSMVEFIRTIYVIRC